MAPITQAVVIGAGGGIGRTCAARLEASATYTRVLRLSRRSEPPLDLLCEPTIAVAATELAAAGEIRLVVDATGFLHNARFRPERSWHHIDPVHMAHAFAINAVGPALLMKHFCPLLPRQGRAVFATLSARVGSIGDNRLGGWHSYRASKAALNQLVRTNAIELRRHNPNAICVALHPGTVHTDLSAPFGTAGLDVSSPSDATARILGVIERLEPAQTGGFFDYHGDAIEW